jgi:hypothetical protein
VLVSGILQDSLTSLPVAQGIVVLESGTELGTTPLYNFFPTQEAATDAHGAFSLCVQNITYPSAIVLEAMDSAGKAYPPYVTQVSGTMKLGNIVMGGCLLTCSAFFGQQETSTPVTINGVINSTPIAITGTAVPTYAMQALDGSKAADGTPNGWALVLPIFTASPGPMFSTTAGACSGVAPYCATYTISVPSQSPLRPLNDRVIQAAVAPNYIIDAYPGNRSACTPTLGFTGFQADGKSLLTGAPGAQLTAQSISFTNCR